MKMLKKHLTLLLALVMMALVVAAAAALRPNRRQNPRPTGNGQSDRPDQEKCKLILATGNYRHLNITMKNQQSHWL